METTEQRVQRVQGLKLNQTKRKGDLQILCWRYFDDLQNIQARFRKM